MSLRHAILGLLQRQPSTGYELTRLFDKSLRTSWHASHSQIYPELARLEGDGLVEVVATGPRRSRTWGITDAGRAELRRWVVEAEPDRSQRNESGVRLFLTQLLPPEDRLVAFRRDLAWVEEQIAELETIRDALTDPEDGFGPQVDFGLRVDATIREWLLEQIERAGG